jgi:hypothetical protein
MLTAPGTVLGTAGYISPEQARGEPATPASDRYSLAVVAFELLTGRRPFGGDTPTTEAFAHLNAPVPRAGSVDPSLPPALDAVFEVALAKDPTARPATARELVRRLRLALEPEPEPAAATRVLAAQPARPTTRRLVRHDHRSRRPRVALAIVALLLVAAGVGAALLAGDGFGPDKAGSDRNANRSAASTGSQTTSTEQTRKGATSEPAVDGVALNRDGYARMQAGDFAGALPLLRQSVLALKGSNTLNEAYADYNLAYTRFALGRCDGVIGLLARSERIQGHRSEIDELRRQWEDRCGSSEQSDEQAAPDRGKGKKGKGKGRGG